MPKKKDRVLSCIQPTSEMHIGNYFGAVANWVALQDVYECIYGIVDLHAMTMPYNPSELRKNTERMFIDMVACGLEPDKSIIIIQSLIPEHTELCWIFNCIASFGELTRMTQFKDKRDLLEATGKPDQFVSAGLFTYPVLQAADILIYRAKYVPVGKDQEQHLELSSNIAERFNKRFGEFFPVPAPLYTEVPKIMSPADPTKKMSKSLGEKHYIGLFEDEQSIRKKIMSAVTDTGPAALPPGVEMSPGVENLFEILKACGKTNEVAALMKEYKSQRLKYVDLKEATAAALVELTSFLRARQKEIESNKEEVWKKVYQMSEKAREIASETLREVRKRVGLPEL
ncbi:MAG: tryptophan--tRNA ligase [bacterium]